MRSYLLLSFLPGLVQCTRLHIFAQNTNALATASILPSSTTASLTTTGHVLHAHLNTDNVFDFGNVSAGSYLLDVHAHTHVFAPLRVDVHQVAAQSEDPEVEVWGTFRGNEWGNKGEKLEVRRLNEKAKGRQDIWGFAVNAVGKKEYLMERQGFSPLAILKSPMILIALGSLAIVFGMPYLMDNMDPELRAEFEERQKSNPLAGGQAANPLQDFDPAAWLAGNSGTKRDSSGSRKNQAAERGVTR